MTRINVSYVPRTTTTTTHFKFLHTRVGDRPLPVDPFFSLMFVLLIVFADSVLQFLRHNHWHNQEKKNCLSMPRISPSSRPSVMWYVSSYHKYELRVLLTLRDRPSP